MPTTLPSRFAPRPLRRRGATLLAGLAVLVGVPVVAGFVAGCAGTGERGTETRAIDRSLLIGAWSVDTVAGEPIDEIMGGVRVRDTIGLEVNGDGDVAGFAGVNRFSAAFDRPGGASGDAFVLGPIRSTKMAGAPGAMAAEGRVLGALGAARRFDAGALADGRLVLLDADDRAVLTLDRRE